MRRELVAFALLLALGCAPASGPPAIRLGDTCTRCGMEIRSRRFACERRTAGRWQVYDSIECLLEDGPGVDADTWLSDYDSEALQRADSLWVLHGSFPTPMGGGYAAFASRSAADRLAIATHGEVTRLAQITREPRPS
jgi:nitrous oxide reductase accessory protein NosL